MLSIDQYNQLSQAFNEALPGLPVTTQDMGEGLTLDREQRLALAHKEIEGTLTFSRIASLAGQIRFNSLPEGVSKEEAAEEICQWAGWEAVANGEVSVEWFTEYGDSAWAPIYQVRGVFEEKRPLIEGFAEKINAIYNDGPVVTTSHDYQEWRYAQQQKGLLLSSSALVDEGDATVEGMLASFIENTGESKKADFCEKMQGFLNEGENLEDGIVRLYNLSFSDKQAVNFFTEFDPCRTALGATTGGFLFALQQGIKAGAVSGDFMAEHGEFIDWCVKYCEIMDSTNFNSRFGKEGAMYTDVLTARPSAYEYLKG